MENAFGSPVVDDDLRSVGDVANSADQRTPLRSPAKVTSPVSLASSGRRQGPKG